MNNLNRRSFLTRSSLAGLATSLPFGRLFGQTPSSLDEISVGVIGVGGRGGGMLKEFVKAPGVRVTAICDADTQNMEARKNEVPGAAMYQDMRRIIDDESIDAVAIFTCNHWHCLAAMWALEAGKHVYVEKPLSHHHWEGRQLVHAARNHNRIVQVGTQQRSDPMQAEIKKFLHEEKALGKIEAVLPLRFGVRAPIGKRSAPLEPPKTVDYDLWLGPAADEPIYRDNLHYDWHWNWNTGNGECGNWGVHLFDDVRNVPLLDRVTIPQRVLCAGGRVNWDDAGETPNVQLTYMDAGGVPVFFGLSNLPTAPGGNQQLKFQGVDTGYLVLCEGGSYRGFRGWGAAYDRDGKEVRKFTGDSGAGHVKNFFDAVRADDRSVLTCDVAQGHASSGWAHVANAAYQAARVSGMPANDASDDQKVVWQQLAELLRGHLKTHSIQLDSTELHTSPMMEIDVEAEQFVGAGAEAANRHMGRPDYREPYVLNEVALKSEGQPA
jgi:predicted dehydrogenase